MALTETVQIQTVSGDRVKAMKVHVRVHVRVGIITYRSLVNRRAPLIA